MLGSGDLVLWQWVVVFFGSAVVLAMAGSVLANAGDEIATRTGLGRLFVGMLLVASATSMPELVTDISAVRAGAPDLAVGDLFGSSMANMAILAGIDLYRRRRVWTGVALGHAHVGSIAIVLTSLAVLGVVTPAGPTIGWVGADTAIIAFLYVAAVAWTHRSPHGVRTIPPELPVPTGIGEAGHPEGRLRSAVIRFLIGAAFVLVAGPALAVSAKEIAAEAGITETFVGVTLLAIATSIPELSASVAATRIGAHDLAVGNLFGSNAINMAILFAADLALTDRPLLTGGSPAQGAAGAAAIALMGIAMAAIIHGGEMRLRRFEPDAILVLLAYAGGLYAVWAAG